MQTERQRDIESKTQREGGAYRDKKRLRNKEELERQAERECDIESKTEREGGDVETKRKCEAKRDRRGKQRGR